MKLLILQFSPISCHFISLRSKYSPQHYYVILKFQNTGWRTKWSSIWSINNIFISITILQTNIQKERILHGDLSSVNKYLPYTVLRFVLSIVDLYNNVFQISIS
jgi:hypothetical protein